MSSNPNTFDATPILSYLSLPSDYTPSPSASPTEFLALHLRQLPPHLLALFSMLLDPHQRTVLPIIRNRRQIYASTVPRELAFPEAHKKWPALWDGRERPGVEQGREEKMWADRGLEFLGGERGLVGKLAQLLGEYEEEREAERTRVARRNVMAQRVGFAEEEEEEEEDDEDDEEDMGPVVEEQESPDQLRVNFERVVREKFIYGLLDSIDYDAVDWDDKWDEVDERDSEERWFDDEEEADAPVMEIDA